MLYKDVWKLFKTSQSSRTVQLWPQRNFYTPFPKTWLFVWKSCEYAPLLQFECSFLFNQYHWRQHLEFDCIFSSPFYTFIRSIALKIHGLLFYKGLNRCNLPPPNLQGRTRQAIWISSLLSLSFLQPLQISICWGLSRLQDEEMALWKPTYTFFVGALQFLDRNVVHSKRHYTREQEAKFWT